MYFKCWCPTCSVLCHLPITYEFIRQERTIQDQRLRHITHYHRKVREHEEGIYVSSFRKDSRSESRTHMSFVTFLCICMYICAMRETNDNKHHSRLLVCCRTDLLAVGVGQESLIQDGSGADHVVREPLLLRRHEPQHFRSRTVRHRLLEHLFF